MSSRAGQNNPRVWIRVRLHTVNGVVETNVKKRHLRENSIPKDENGLFIVYDQYNNPIHFKEWEIDGVKLPARKKNKYGGYDNG